MLFSHSLECYLWKIRDKFVEINTWDLLWKLNKKFWFEWYKFLLWFNLSYLDNDMLSSPSLRVFHSHELIFLARVPTRFLLVKWFLQGVLLNLMRIWRKLNILWMYRLKNESFLFFKTERNDLSRITII